MKRILVLLLIGIMLISSVSFAAPKEIMIKDILNRVKVTEDVNEPSDGQNTVYVKFPKLGEFTVFTVERVRGLNNLSNTVADYINDTSFFDYEGGFDITVDEDGKEWVELSFWYTRVNVYPYIINVVMENEKKNFIYEFTYDSSKSFKDISERLVFSEVAVTGHPEHNEVTLIFPKMGFELTKLHIIRDRTGSLTTTNVDYIKGDNNEWWEGEYSISDDGNGFITVKFSYKIGNIEKFTINILTVAGKSGVSFGCSREYEPLNNLED